VVPDACPTGSHSIVVLSEIEKPVWHRTQFNYIMCCPSCQELASRSYVNLYWSGIILSTDNRTGRATSIQDQMTVDERRKCLLTMQKRHEHAGRKQRGRSSDEMEAVTELFCESLNRLTSSNLEQRTRRHRCARTSSCTEVDAGFGIASANSDVQRDVLVLQTGRSCSTRSRMAGSGHFPLCVPPATARDLLLRKRDPSQRLQNCFSVIE
jgi:hypothetical protein